MKLIIEKANDLYSLSLQSGHFNGTLNSLSKEHLVSLKEEIEKAISSEESSHYYTWNPRSKRLEKN